MYKVYIKVSYIELCFRFDDSSTAVNFMMKAIKNYNPKGSSDDRTIEVRMEIDAGMAIFEEDDF